MSCGYNASIRSSAEYPVVPFPSCIVSETSALSSKRNASPAHSHHYLIISASTRTIVHASAGCAREWRVSPHR